jgi:MoaD family protein
LHVAVRSGKKLQITVLFFTILREIVDKKEENLQFPNDTKVTISEVLKDLNGRYGKPFAEYVFEPQIDEVKTFLQFFVNGQSASAKNGLETMLYDGDVLAIVPPVGGG